MTAMDAVYRVLPLLQWMIVVSLLVVSGIAWSFSLWIIPVIKLNKSSSAILQLEETSRRGGKWLEPLNASFAFFFGINALLLSKHPNPAEAAGWKCYATASLTLLQVAWWERVMIFPLEAHIAKMRKNKPSLGEFQENCMDDPSQQVLHQSLDRWSQWHVVRATLPLVAALIALSARSQI
ncbi:hypothetical protein T440DRAFT_456868 [Plenodomus tracheiphilus IPT5]|uniref:DUF1772-domain-containing protein n=1 Tax=Plenodomus tracheiphilus IPT5 TaxID=1408161 RepID=A0A6A7AUX8_9PLEO|nr:hypothetical protein T440DRAFT_456868 [Plenodomus tracheiphilus IPT5]